MKGVLRQIFISVSVVVIKCAIHMITASEIRDTITAV